LFLVYALSICKFRNRKTHTLDPLKKIDKGFEWLTNGQWLVVDGQWSSVALGRAQWLQLISRDYVFQFNESEKN